MADRTKKVSLIDRIKAKLMKTGMNERKATETAKIIAPTARAAIKAEEATKTSKAKPRKGVRVGAKVGKKAVKKSVRSRVKKALSADKPIALDLSGSAPQDLVEHGDVIENDEPLYDLGVVPVQGEKNLDPMRIIDGLTSRATYIVAAAKDEIGFIAVRKFSDNEYKVKFYPDMKFWDFDQAKAESLGFKNHLKRSMYERYMVDRNQLEQLMLRVEAMRPVMDKMMEFVGRFKFVRFATLSSALTKLMSGVGRRLSINA